MNNAQLIDYIYKNSDVAKKDADKAVELVAKAIRDTLDGGGSVTLAGVGIFYVGKMAARLRRNPRTQAPIQVPAQKKPQFQPCGSLKKLLN